MKPGCQIWPWNDNMLNSSCCSGFPDKTESVATRKQVTLHSWERGSYLWAPYELRKYTTHRKVDRDKRLLDKPKHSWAKNNSTGRQWICLHLIGKLLPVLWSGTGNNHIYSYEVLFIFIRRTQNVNKISCRPEILHLNRIQRVLCLYSNAKFVFWKKKNLIFHPVNG